ncbi:unnamed protein product [Meganyctiphanes norvegica]|uniref:NIPSNAP domain-containing protein n=1 Tax=Meganyctiphanes norvegica TaxID=48144 RepID=A0AAV2QQS5_MEGNR
MASSFLLLRTTLGANIYRTGIRSLTTSGVRQSSSNGDAVGKVYELRTYSVYPQKMRDFLNLTAEEFHLRTAHSVLLGYWTAEIGGLNQVVHLWEYDSLSHRADVRARLAGDPEWLGRYVSKVIDSWQQQDNVLLTLLPGTSLNTPQGTGVYQIVSLNLCGAPAVWSSALVEFVKNSSMTSGSTLVGTWKTALGPGNMAVLLWQHSDPDGCIRLRDALDDTITNVALQNHVSASHSKLLLPHIVSSWK